MKIERQLFKISISEAISSSILLLVILNGIVLLVSLFIGEPRFFLYNNAWIFQIAFPIINGIIHAVMRRNGVLRITEFDDIEVVKNEIKEVIPKNKIIKTDSDSQHDSYTQRTKWGKFFNLFFREDINVKYTKEEILIYGKSYMFLSIESKLRFLK